MDLTHVKASVRSGQQYSRPGHSLRYISWPRETKGVRASRIDCSANRKVFIPTEELQDISYFSPKGSLISRKTTHLRVALKEGLGKVLLPRPSNPS